MGRVRSKRKDREKKRSDRRNKKQEESWRKYKIKKRGENKKQEKR